MSLRLNSHWKTRDAQIAIVWVGKKKTYCKEISLYGSYFMCVINIFIYHIQYFYSYIIPMLFYHIWQIYICRVYFNASMFNTCNKMYKELFKRIIQWIRTVSHFIEHTLDHCMYLCINGKSPNNPICHRCSIIHSCFKV